MASIQERRDKSGRLISYSIRVHRGRDAEGKQLKPWTATFDVAPTWTEKSARKKAEAYAATFEDQCKKGLLSDSRQRFDTYCEYVLDLKERRGKLKHSTLVRYRELTERIYPAIGHMKITAIRADHLNSFYTSLEKPGAGKGKVWATAKVDFVALLREKGITRAALADAAGVQIRNVYAVVKGERVAQTAAAAVAAALGAKTEQLFTLEAESRDLSPKTIVEYHRLISSVLAQAEKEGIVPFNAASKATPPQVPKKTPNYFQPETIIAIRDALEDEPLKWKVITHIFLITGARRGEIAGLKREHLDFTKNKVHFCNNLLYAPDVGIYEDTTKNETSDRWVALPAETMQLLKAYLAWQDGERLRLKGYYNFQGFLFTKDNGDPIHPDSITGWMDKFSKRRGLPHINPHSFRHTMASMLYFGGADDVSISKRLGHAKVSTTSDIYAHIIREADERNAGILEDVYLKKA